MVAGDTRVVGSVSRVRQLCNVKIRNRNDVKMLALQVGDHLLECRKSIRIYRERSIVLLIVDVKIDCIRRYFVGAEAIGYLTYPRFRIVTVARLLIAK